jgi:hypothetical protein
MLATTILATVSLTWTRVKSRQILLQLYDGTPSHLRAPTSTRVNTSIRQLGDVEDCRQTVEGEQEDKLLDDPSFYTGVDIWLQTATTGI